MKYIVTIFLVLFGHFLSSGQISFSVDVNMLSDAGFQVFADKMENQFVVYAATNCDGTNDCTGLIALDESLQTRWISVFSAQPQRLKLSGVDGFMKYGDTYYLLSNTENLSTGISGFRITTVNPEGELLSTEEHFFNENALLRSIKLSPDSSIYVFGHISIDNKSHLMLNRLNDSLKVVRTSVYSKLAYQEFNPETFNFFENGDILICGTAVSELPSSNRRKAWLIVTDSSGDVKWDRIYGDSSFQHLAKAVILKENNIGLSWVKTEDVQYPEPFIYDWPPSVSMLDSNGHRTWEYTFISEFEKYVINIRPAKDGGILGVGYDSNLTDQNPDFPFAGWVFKLSKLGQLEWERTIVDTSNGGTIGINILYDIVELETGELLCVGGKIDTVGVGFLNENTWIVLLDTVGCVIPDCSQVEILTSVKNFNSSESIDDLKIFPNPDYTGNVAIQSNTHVIDKVTMFTLDGYLVKANEYPGHEFEVTMSTGDVPTGIYFLKIDFDGNRSKFARLVIIRDY